jgi:diaminopimelate decarboxylase/aspartate kinase
VVVHSALATVSNKLDELLHRALEMDVTAQVAGIRELHLRLAAGLQVDGEKELGGYFRELEQLLAGIHLIREVSPRIQARVMGLGELMATRLGAAYLARVGLKVTWLDARELLRSNMPPGPMSVLPGWPPTVISILMQNCRRALPPNPAWC